GRDRASVFGGVDPRSPPPRPTQGQDVRLEAEIPFDIAAEGGTHDLHLQRNGKPERLSVKIPAGVDTGSVIRLTGQGNPAALGMPAGDLLVQIKVGPHPWFRRAGCDLLIDVPITPAEAVLGAKVDVPTITGETIIVTVPPGTSSGTKLRLRGKGVVHQKTKRRGDQFVIVKIVVPQQQDDETRRLYEKISAKTTGSPRDGLW
ncbi:MAG: J domain-containing protein, partial [Nitrospinae bacterium]|nr:J domain-containing protein [Nitrospinota bacterium]